MNDNIKACRRCHRLFNWIAGPPICPNCQDAMEKKFTEVREYIREHDKASIVEVSEEVGVAVPQIQQWVREERLTFSKDSDFVLACEHCGAQILTGRFCAECKKKLAGSLSDAFNEDHDSLQRKDHGVGFLAKKRA